MTPNALASILTEILERVKRIEAAVMADEDEQLPPPCPGCGAPGELQAEAGDVMVCGGCGANYAPGAPEQEAAHGAT